MIKTAGHWQLLFKLAYCAPCRRYIVPQHVGGRYLFNIHLCLILRI